MNFLRQIDTPTNKMGFLFSKSCDEPISQYESLLQDWQISVAEQTAKTDTVLQDAYAQADQGQSFDAW